MLRPQHIRLFNQILDELWKYSGHDLRTLAEDAEVSLSTLYKWQSTPPISPHFRTLAQVAEGLGYDIELKKRRKLRSVA